VIRFGKIKILHSQKYSVYYGYGITTGSELYLKEGLIESVQEEEIEL